jgi:hypothetical protein
MPYTEKQHRLFQAIAHGWKPDRMKGPSREEAKKMAAEGVKGEPDTPQGRAIKRGMRRG